MFTTNAGGLDTAIRAVLGIAIMVVAAIVADAHPFLALGAALFATALLATAIAGVCPLYAALGLDTHPKRPPQPRIEAPRELVHQH